MRPSCERSFTVALVITAGKVDLSVTHTSKWAATKTVVPDSAASSTHGNSKLSIQKIWGFEFVKHSYVPGEQRVQQKFLKSPPPFLPHFPEISIPFSFPFFLSDLDFNI